MNYEHFVLRLEKKYPPNQRGYGCLSISEDLALVILSQRIANLSVSVAQTSQTKKNGPIGEVNHYITIVKEPDEKFVGIDATRPFYDSGNNYWIFNADTEKKLMVILSNHYGGAWSIQHKWLHEMPDWYNESKL